MGQGRGRRGPQRQRGHAARPLGTYRRNASPPPGNTGVQTPGEAVSRLISRYAAQVGARELLPQEKGLRGCSRWVLPGTAAVQLLHVPSHKAGAFGGLQRCGSVWQCPVCASKISERRRVELSEAVARWRAQGGEVLLITYTIRHHRADVLTESLEGLLKARKGLLSGKAAASFTRRYGIAGRVRALETTHGHANGWHPHVHELVFVQAGCDREALAAELLERWNRRVQAAGLRDVNAHGVDVRSGDELVSDYVAKFGRETSWSLEHEVTKQVTKQGSEHGRTPAQLLADYLAGDQHAGKLWQEYAQVFKGRRQLVWSDGLRELLGLEAEQSDEEIAAEQREEARLMEELTQPEWAHVLGNDARAELLAVLGRGSVAELRELLAALGIQRFGLRRDAGAGPEGDEKGEEGEEQRATEVEADPQVPVVPAESDLPGDSPGRAAGRGVVVGDVPAVCGHDQPAREGVGQEPSVLFVPPLRPPRKRRKRR